jgi:hypothetical protein
MLNGLSARLSSGETIPTVISGSVTPNGKVKPRQLEFSSQEYVPGVTTVAVVGKVKKLDRSTAKFVIGNLVVDYASLLAGADVSVEVGSVVQVIGTRSSASAELAATSVTMR